MQAFLDTRDIVTLVIQIVWYMYVIWQIEREKGGPKGKKEMVQLTSYLPF